MKPDFALDFRDNQIALLHRQEGGWAAIGRVAMDDPDLDAAMSYLRATALGLSPRGISTKLILPNNAILYTTLPDLPYDAAKRSAQIAADLTGRTPYAVADLVWDWTDAGASAEVAVIARETLDEAEAFAAQHRFNPISFAAIPNSGNFEGEVWFGASALSQTLLAQGEVVQRDEVFAFAPPVEDAPKAALSASDFEMGDDENGSPVDAADADAPPPRDETDVAQDTGDQVPVAQNMGAQDLGAHDTAEIAEIEDGTASTQQSPDLAADLAEADLGADGPVVDDGREVWQDFGASNDSAPQIQAEPAQSDILAAQDTDPPPAPASFDAAMAELPEENDNQGIADPEEAPMAEDVPLMDAPGEELQAADLTAQKWSN
ncbi:MAG: hypothetical protein U5N55_07340 [Cypionkella sp.]|nr:hypothetical protein [Cypionkella sp.]